MPLTFNADNMTLNHTDGSHKHKSPVRQLTDQAFININLKLNSTTQTLT